MLDKEFLCVLSFIMQDHQVPSVPSIDEKSKGELKFIFFIIPCVKSSTYDPLLISNLSTTLMTLFVVVKLLLLSFCCIQSARKRRYTDDRSTVNVLPSPRYFR